MALHEDPLTPPPLPPQPSSPNSLLMLGTLGLPPAGPLFQTAQISCSFLFQQTTLSLLFSCCVALQVAGRMVKYSYYIARISSFIASKMQSSVTKNLVFPSCGDIKLLQLMVRFAHTIPHSSSFQ